MSVWQSTSALAWMFTLGEDDAGFAENEQCTPASSSTDWDAVCVSRRLLVQIPELAE